MPEVIRTAFFGAVFASVDDFEGVENSLPPDQRHELSQIFFQSANMMLDHSIIHDRRQGMAGIYFFSGDREAVQSMQEQYIRDTRSVLQSICPGQTLTFFVGNIYEGYEQIRRSYEEAKTLYEERFIYANGSVNTYRSAERKLKKQQKVLPMEELINVQAFVKYLLNWDQAAADRELELFREKLLQSGGNSYIYLQVVIANLYGLLREEFKKLDISSEDPVFITMDEYQQLSALENVDKTIERLHNLSERIIHRLQNRTENKYTQMILTAKEYIGQHYTDHTLTMEEAAKAVHMSSSFFSVQFKSITGQSFSEYLIALRIEQAKNLLQNTDMLAYEIAEAVGYDTAAYYSTAFKKATGYSPSEYKKKCRKKDI